MTSTGLRWGGPRIGRGLVEFLPPFVVAVLILPFVIAFGKFSPWQPSTIDLQVYVYAVKDLLAGRDIFETTTPFWHLYFIYPPIAAILMIPLAFGPYLMWQLIWTAGLVWAQQSVMKRCGLPRGWKLALLSIAVLVAMEPLRTTLGYGQVNTILMALVVADLLPDAPGEKRLIPRGALIGLAAAIKLTPALFCVFLFLLGHKKAAVTGAASFVIFSGIGAIFLWSETVQFWTGLSGGDTRTASPLYVGNQSLLGVTNRLLESSTLATVLGLALSAIVALLSAVVAAHWWKAGEKVFAIGLIGLATCLASPLSWTHHYVWILPLGIAVLGRTGQRATLPGFARVIGGLWVLWVSACLPLAVLPYGGNLELGYDWLQEVVANLGPLLGVCLLIGLAWRLVSLSRAAVSEPARAG